MGIIKRGESGIGSIREYYNELKSDAWQGNTRDIRAPHYGPTGRRKHLHGATILGGLYLLGQFRSRTPRLATAAKYAVAPILGTTKLGKVANAAVDALRAGQQLGVLPNGASSNYADMPLITDPIAVAKSIFRQAPVMNEIRKKYGLSYDGDKSYSDKLGSPESPDMVPVTFKTGQGHRIPVRGTITGLSDTITPTWNESAYVGRPQAVVTYGGFAREMSFDLTLAAVNPYQLRPMWHKINEISKLVLPQADVNSTRFAGRLTELTIGNYIEDQLAVLTGITITPVEDSYWETEDPEVAHPSLTLDSSLGNKLQGEVKRKMDKLKVLKQSTFTEGDKAVNNVPTMIPLSRKKRQKMVTDGTDNKYIMPRVVTLSLSFKILHNEIPGTDDGRQLFNVNEGPDLAATRFVPPIPTQGGLQ